MSNRVNVHQVQPLAYQALLELEKYLNQTKLEKSLKELIKIRVSQINGCAFCIDMHTKDARKYGETEQRIYALSAWRDTPFFTEVERAALALAEEMTLISKGVTDETYNHLAKVLDEVSVAQVIMAVITINGWNRLAITTHLQPVKD
ncbi:carboxymuconolactone decarboxylase family protein [Pedobacter sp. AW31-3R]|uniref:carboxymuconolactone decarboxylase family protein n=1 Tax=Pedobacter sp. AW31-3R TaxID=3445781 RepID=UPI003F9EFCFA